MAYSMSNQISATSANLAAGEVPVAAKMPVAAKTQGSTPNFFNPYLLNEHERKRNKIADHFSKRLLDLILVLIGLPICLPIMLVVAILIKIDSPGPIFYRQERVGTKRRVQNGKIEWEVANFPILKFRSMVADASDAIHQAHVNAWINGELDVAGDVNARAKVQDDPRITRVGHFIRKTSLDELPQFFNILLGQMSVVGPRPVLPYEVAHYEPRHYERLNALPGLTGLWQVAGRGIVSFDEMMRLDIEYVRTRTLWQDIMIICRTIPAVVSGSGAA